LRGANKPIYAITSQLPHRLAEIRGLRSSQGKNFIGKDVTVVQGLLDLGGQKGKSETLAISGKYAPQLPDLPAGSFGAPQWAPSVAVQDHGERKLLAFLRGKLGPKDTGVLVISVNHPKGYPPCGHHCAPDIESFARDFPGIRVVVQVIDEAVGSF
jgi:hypothetical protein